MIENQKIRPAQVIGPLGEPLTLESLPPSSTTRWVVRRKADKGGDYNVALIDLKEGARMMSRVEGVAPTEVKIGMAVSAHIGLIDGQHAVVFYNKEQGSKEW